jgi:AhpD family alkylhydroperoxidase
MNERILEEKNHLGIKRFFNLDTAAYRDGALDGSTKELLGLVASMVLRCNDCIDYHLQQCVDAGFSDDELDDAMNVALVVGGSIVIPHLRHAVETIDLLRAERAATAEHGGSGEEDSDSDEPGSEAPGSAAASQA